MQNLYKKKKTSLKDALNLIKSGNRVFISSSCGEPQYLVKGLSENSKNYTDLEIVRVFSLETTPLTLIANKTEDRYFNIKSFYIGSSILSEFDKNKRFITPVNLSSIPTLFKTKKMPIDVALIQVSPPDEFGNMSLGISVEVNLAAALYSKKIIAQVNHNMPRVFGNSNINIKDIDAIVEYKEPLLTIVSQPDLKYADIIAKHMERLIDDGSTMQLGIGIIPKSILLALSDKNDIGIHTQYMTNTLMSLINKGIITNAKKGFNKGKTIVSGAIGTKELYDFLDNNDLIGFYPSDYINNPAIIAKNNKMTSVNVAMSIDLTGQVAIDSFYYNNFCGANGVLDFTRGAAMSKNGRPVIILTSISRDGKKSRIVPLLKASVVIPKSDVYYVITVEDKLDNVQIHCINASRLHVNI